jgi:hypothetical protein
MVNSVFGNAFSFAAEPQAVDHNYGGPMALSYVLNGSPVAGASILIFRKSDYDAGRQSNDYVLAARRQLADGTWSAAVELDAGEYVLRFAREDVAGPDDFPLQVT